MDLEALARRAWLAFWDEADPVTADDIPPDVDWLQYAEHPDGDVRYGALLIWTWQHRATDPAAQAQAAAVYQRTEAGTSQRDTVEWILSDYLPDGLSPKVDAQRRRWTEWSQLEHTLTHQWDAGDDAGVVQTLAGIFSRDPLYPWAPSWLAGQGLNAVDRAAGIVLALMDRLSAHGGECRLWVLALLDGEPFLSYRRTRGALWPALEQRLTEGETQQLREDWRILDACAEGPG